MASKLRYDTASRPPCAVRPVAVFAGFAFALATSLSAHAQDAWPSRQVTVLVPYPAGGFIDSVTRIVSEGLREKSGQPFVIINKVGGNGKVALGDLVRAAPDGHTLLTNNDGGMGTPPGVDKNFKYDPAKDYTSLSQIVDSKFILVVRAGLPVKTLGELIALAKSSPKPLSYASPGQGSTPHIGMEYFSRQIGAEMTHVPYSGAAPALNDIVGGQVDVYMASVPSVVGHLGSDKIRPLALMSKSQLAAYPNVPTMEQAGMPGFIIDGWLGLFGPPNMSADLRGRVSRAVADVVRDPKYADKLRANGVDPITKDSDAFSKFYLAEVLRWKNFSNEHNIKVGD